MHIALIADTAWLDEDLAYFRQLVVGLIDEQAQVTQVIPDRVPLGEAGAFGERVDWTDHAWPIIRRVRLRRLLPRLDELGVNLIHALNHRVWDGGLDLAERLNIPILLGATCRLDAAAAPRTAKRQTATQTSFAATTTPIADSLRKSVGPDTPVEVCRQGVHVPSEPEPFNADGVLCAVVTGDGEHDAQYEAVLTAIAHIVTKHPQSQFFFDGQTSDQRQLWQAARRHNLLAHISLIPRRLGHHEMLLRADLLIQPQTLGRSRSLTLQAMAVGVPVLALNDPWLDYLIDGRTAWVVPEPDPDLWASLILRAVDEPENSLKLIASAREYVRENHLASNQLEHTIEVYRALAAESIRFPQPAGAALVDR